jgi:hypothetical protein
MPGEKTDVSFVDVRILSAIEDAKFTVRATRKNPNAYEVDFGQGPFYSTVSVSTKDRNGANKTLAALPEHIEGLRKVITTYTTPLRGGLSSYGSAKPWSRKERS